MTHIQTNDGEMPMISNSSVSSSPESLIGRKQTSNAAIVSYNRPDDMLPLTPSNSKRRSTPTSTPQPLYDPSKAKIRGQSRPVDMLPLCPLKSPLSGGSASSYKVKGIKIKREWLVTDEVSIESLEQHEENPICGDIQTSSSVISPPLSC